MVRIVVGYAIIRSTAHRHRAAATTATTTTAAVTYGIMLVRFVLSCNLLYYTILVYIYMVTCYTK